MFEILSQFDLYKFFVILHIIGTAIGAGGATLSDILFFKSIEDGRIQKSEFTLLHTAGFAVWSGLGLLILSGMGMVILQLYDGVNLLALSTKLQSKIVIVSMILLNGVFLHWKIFPLFRKSLDKNLTKGVLLSHADIIFTSGAVSAVSWYSALIIGAWRGLSASPFVILAIYTSVLICAIIVAQIVGRIQVRRIASKIEDLDRP